MTPSINMIASLWAADLASLAATAAASIAPVSA